jgi:hypothetical protein
MLRWLIGLAAASLAIPSLQAAPLLHALSLRELAYQAEIVVVATPTDAKQVGRVKVERCFKGKLQPGQEIQVDGLSPFFPINGDILYPRLASACLFLTAGPGSERYQMAPTGLMCLGKSMGIYRPLPWVEVGDFRLQLRGDRDQWEGLLDEVRETVAEVNRLQRARDLPVSRGRNEALFAWIDRHRREIQEASSLRRSPSQDKIAAPLLPGELQDQRERGWGDLERLPFLWILDSGVLSDCWLASDLYAEINGGDCLALDRPTFCSRTGRDFLIETARDERQLEGSRRRALRLLAGQATLRGSGQPMEAAEQLALLERLRPLLQARLATTRGLTALTVREISRGIAPAAEFRKELLQPLVQAYQAEKPGMARDALAETVRLIGGVAEWKTLTGQPDGLAAYLQDLEARPDQIRFWLSLRRREPIKEAPTMVLERLGPDGKVVEKKSIPLPALEPTPWKWKTDWDSMLPLFVQHPVQGLELGAWRIVVEGAAGGDKIPWRSEPRLFQVVGVGKPGTLQPVNPQQPTPRYAVLPADD